MISKKRAAIGVAIGALIGFQLSGIYVSPDFESPMIYKMLHAYSAVAGYFSRLAESFGYGIEAANMRHLLNIMAPATTDARVKEWIDEIVGTTVKIYTPLQTSGTSLLPLMIFYHGGGFAFGGLKTYDEYLRGFVKQANMIVVSVDYKMSPEYAYPKQIDECYAVTRFFLDNAEQFHADGSRVALAGDSAGGNIATVLTRRLLADQVPRQPKLQVLIYPWVQQVDYLLPSQIFYETRSIISSSKVTLSKFTPWYLGIFDVSEEVERVFATNAHWLLIEDAAERERMRALLDVESRLDAKYKTGRTYYENNAVVRKYAQLGQLDEQHLLKRDPKMARLFRKLFDADISPLLADEKQLIGMPRTYMVLLEWDSLKDEGLLYERRLREAGVQVDLAFYENAFHPIANMVSSNPLFSFKVARQMQADLVKYLKANL